MSDKDWRKSISIHSDWLVPDVVVSCSERGQAQIPKKDLCREFWPNWLAVLLVSLGGRGALGDLVWEPFLRAMEKPETNEDQQWYHSIFNLFLSDSA